MCVPFDRVIMDDPRKLSRELCPDDTSPTQFLVSLDITLGALWDYIVSLISICICVWVPWEMVMMKTYKNTQIKMVQL